MPTTSIRFRDKPGLSGRDSLTRFGPTMLILIGFDLAFQPESPTLPKLSDERYPALVDTGASESCIDAGLAARLGLPVVARQTIAGPQGSSIVNLHLAQIYIPDLKWTLYGRFAGIQLGTGGQPHLALLGRSFLTNFTMTYEGRAGAVTISND